MEVTEDDILTQWEACQGVLLSSYILSQEYGTQTNMHLFSWVNSSDFDTPRGWPEEIEQLHCIVPNGASR